MVVLVAKINFSQMEFCSQHQTQHAESFSTEKLLKKPTVSRFDTKLPKLMPDG